MMPSATIPGREAESRLLERLLLSKEAQLISVYGRRRIGKTHLIREFYRDKGLYLQFTGVNDATQTEQLANFHDELNSLFHRWEVKNSPKDWREAFKRLVESIRSVEKTQRVIVFFDEVPWLSKKSLFLKSFEYSWNQHLSTIPNLTVVLCGSSSSWMVKHIIQNKGGLHGRLTGKLHLQPFTLKQAEEFLMNRGIRYSRQHIVELYMALGGVAQYLKAVPVGMSPTQAIQELCFTPQGILYREFYPLYRSLFDNAEKYINIVQILASSKSGLSTAEILEKAGMTSGGSSSKLLRELEEAGIIMKLTELGKKKRDTIYRLIDEYSLFYLQWIQDASPSIISGKSNVNWQLQQQSQRYAVWAGYAFENLCMRHIPQIKQALGLAAVSTFEACWSGSSEHYGKAQIDLVIDRADRCINLCEIKHWNNPLSLDKKFADQLERKRNIFKSSTNTRKAIFTTLITPYGVKSTDHHNYAMDQQVNLDDLFS